MMKNSIFALVLALPLSASAFSCLPANPISSVTYYNTVGARGWGWVCNGEVNVIVQLKDFYTSAVCGRAVEGLIRRYWDSESTENLDRMNRALRDCQKIPAAGTDELALYNRTRNAIKDKTLKEHRAKLGVK